MAERSYRWLFWTLVIVGLSLDQYSKYAIFGWLAGIVSPRGQHEHQVKEGVFRLVVQFDRPEEATRSGTWRKLQTLSHEPLPIVNHGALFGLGGQYKYLANGIFAVVSIIAAVTIMLCSMQRWLVTDLTLTTALGLILAGTIGNLYDRLIFNGVRDFLHFYWIEWPVFNVADCCLVVGAGPLLLQAFWSQAPVEGETSPAKPAETLAAN